MESCIPLQPCAGKNTAQDERKKTARRTERQRVKKNMFSGLERSPQKTHNTKHRKNRRVALKHHNIQHKTLGKIELVAVDPSKTTTTTTTKHAFALSGRFHQKLYSHETGSKYSRFETFPPNPTIVFSNKSFVTGVVF